MRADSAIKTLADFVAAAKDKPGQLKQAGGSITSRENVVRQLLMTHTGARWSFISFPGGGERLAALLGGHVDLMMILDPSEAREQPSLRCTLRSSLTCWRDRNELTTGLNIASRTSMRRVRMPPL